MNVLELVRMAANTPRTERKDYTGCRSCKDKMLAKMKAGIAQNDSAASLSLTAVLPACNEPDLDNTVASILTTPGPVDVVIVDDASETPIPGAAARHERRWGGPRSRQQGALLAMGDYLAFPDAHMRFPDGILRRLVQIARETGGIAYCGCNGQIAAELRLMPDGLLYAKWYTPKQTGLVRTSSMMGASYVVSREVLNRMGGWIGLPGMLGSQELAMSILAARHNVPITCDTSMQAWHQFRKDSELPFPPDYVGHMMNRAATFRLLFEDATWAGLWRPRLAASGVPESILAEVERPYIMEYGRKLRERCVVSDEEFLSSHGVTRQ